MTVLAIYLACSCLVVLCAALFTFQTWEHRRFAHSRTQKRQIEGQNARVALIAPCKGLDVELHANLARLFEQDYANYELVLVVDSPDDPAFPLLQSLIKRYADRAASDRAAMYSSASRPVGRTPAERDRQRAATPSRFQARIIIAGPARDCSQKIHNLRTAVERLSPDVEVLAFVDSDTRPERDWLRQLVRRLRPNLADAATSYRWFVPLSNRLPNLLLASLDHSLTPMAGPSWHHLVWGGSWAIRRATFDAIGLDAAWSTALSDDLMASRLLAEAGTVVEYEPAAMVASPLDVSWTEMMRFLRRQFAVVRWHEPRWWFVGLSVSVFNQCFFWSSLVAGLTLWAAGHPQARAPLSIVATLYALNIYRACLRQSASRYFLPEWDEQLAVARRFDILLHPLAGPLNASGLIGSALGRHVIWRGIHYAPRGEGAVEILSPLGGPQLSIVGSSERREASRPDKISRAA